MKKLLKATVGALILGMTTGLFALPQHAQAASKTTYVPTKIKRIMSNKCW